MKNYYAHFEKQKLTFVEKINQDYESGVNKARNKISAHNKFFSELNKGHLALQYKLGLNSHFLNQVEDTFEHDNTRDIPEIFNSSIEALGATDVKLLISDLAELSAMDSFYGEKYVKARLLNPPIENQNEKLDLENKNPVFEAIPLRRQVLAIRYLLEEAHENVKSSLSTVDDTVIARFVQFLTGRELNNPIIKNTNIYKKVRAPLNLSEKQAQEDLQNIRTLFEDLNLQNIASKISLEISKRDKTNK